jgi:hypothetical protein
MSSTSTGLPAGVAAELVLEPVLKPRTVFRVTFASSLHQRQALLRSLTPNRELGHKPRKIERVYTVVHFAISTWTTEAAALASARTWPQNGDHILRLDIPPGLGFCVDRPRNEANKHRTLWSPPAQILQCVADIKST